MKPLKNGRMIPLKPLLKAIRFRGWFTTHRGVCDAWHDPPSRGKRWGNPTFLVAFPYLTMFKFTDFTGVYLPKSANLKLMNKYDIWFSNIAKIIGIGGTPFSDRPYCMQMFQHLAILERIGAIILPSHTWQCPSRSWWKSVTGRFTNCRTQRHFASEYLKSTS